MTAYAPLDVANDTLTKEVIRQTQRAAALEARLAALLEHCEYVRDAATFDKRRHEVKLTDTIWSAFCRQIKLARKES
jgi:hypothetical protein